MACPTQSGGECAPRIFTFDVNPRDQIFLSVHIMSVAYVDSEDRYTLRKVPSVRGKLTEAILYFVPTDGMDRRLLHGDLSSRISGQIRC